MLSGSLRLSQDPQYHPQPQACAHHTSARQFWSTGSSLGRAKIKLQRWVPKGCILVPSWLHLSWTIRSASLMDTSSIRSNGHLALPHDHSPTKRGTSLGQSQCGQVTREQRGSPNIPDPTTGSLGRVSRSTEWGIRKEQLRCVEYPLLSPSPQKGRQHLSICIISSS